MEDTPENAVENTVLYSTDPSITPSRPSSPEIASIDRRHLLVFSGSSSWMYQLPPRGKVVIGRAENADLRINDPSISRQHAQVVIDDDTVTISDLGSQNGTRVNHVRIVGEHVLRPNDVITLHKTTLLLHSHVASTPSVLEAKAFRQRLESEIDRAIRYERLFALLCVIWPERVADRRAIERVIGEQLRRIDASGWLDDQTLHILLAEVPFEAATAIATRLRGKLAADARLGIASCPGDGYDIDDLLASARNAASSAAPGAIGEVAREYQTMTYGSLRVIVADPAMVRLYALVERLAPVDLPMLITGETGCGKEVVATAIHSLSARRGRKLVSLNCAAIAETLVESELFGHEKGAFSGAVAAKPGLLEAASGSTLFLDEIGELSLNVQAKLLRVLEMQKLTRVGDVHEREVDVRIVAATNRDLEREVEAGRFRQDLFFRLSAAQLVIPPLRQRPRELPLLAALFLEDACKKNGREPMQISESAMSALLEHTWPGNARELRNLMQYIAAAHKVDVVTAEHVAERLAAGRVPRTGPMQAAPVEAGAFRPLADEIRELEIARIKEALEAAGNNQTRAAAILSVPVRTFFEKAKLYGLTPKKKKD